MSAALIWYATLAAAIVAFLVGMAVKGPVLGLVFAGFAVFAAVQFLE